MRGANRDPQPPAGCHKHRTQQQRRADARSKLIEIAIQQICERGLAYITTAQIADRAGMTRGALQHHFGTRDDYIRAVLIALSDRVVERLEHQPPAVTHGPGPLVRRCIAGLGRILLSREQLAITDISLSSRSIPPLQADNEQTSLRLMAAYGAAWHRWLDHAYPEPAVEKSFDIFRFFCSGMLVISYHHLDSPDHDDDFALCAELVEAALAR